MTIQPVFDSEENVPDISLKELYTKDEATGKMVLSPTALKGFKTEDEFKKTYGALQQERKLKATFESELQGLLNGKTKEEVLAILDQFEATPAQTQQGDQKPLTQAEIDKIVHGKTLQAEREKGDLLKKTKALEEQLNAFVQEKKERSISDMLRQSAHKLNARPDALDVVLRFSSDFDVDELGDVKTRDGHYTPEEFVVGLQEKYPFLFNAPQGAGVTGSGKVTAGGKRTITPEQASDPVFMSREIFGKGVDYTIRRS